MNFEKISFLFIISILAFVSCDNSDENDPQIIFGSWQYSNIEEYVISTNNDSLSAAIRYQEFAQREDSLIMHFDGEGIVCLGNKVEAKTDICYKYAYDGKDKLTVYPTDSTKDDQKFDIIGNIAIYKTGPISIYTDADGTFTQKTFDRLVKDYPETMKGLKIEDLKVYNVYFFELYKKLMYYYY